jgi:uncharacterized protein YjbJ (UPF0337 family)
MVEPAKITEKAAELAGKAVEAAGPLKDKATGAAGQAAAAVGPLKEKAEDLLDKAGEIAAQGVSTVAENLDKVTGGKYSDKISSVSAKIEERLDPTAE